MWYQHRSRKLGESKLGLLQGTLDLMVLQTLIAMGRALSMSPEGDLR
jgi:hypothetical protein